MAIGGMLAGVGGGAVASIVVKATTADAEKALKNLGDRISGTEKATGGMMGAMRVAGPIVAGIGIAAAGAAVHLATMASKGVDIRNAFKKMAEESGRSSDELLRNISAAARGTVSQVDLMKQANQAFLLIGAEVGDKLPRMMEIARAAAKATGQEVGFMFESIVTGIGRQSKLILDNLGINIRMEEAQQKYAASLGKTVEQLTEAEKKQAFLNEAMAQGESIIRRAGADQVSLAEKMAQANAAIDNMKQAIGEFLIPILGAAASALTGLGDVLGQAAEAHDINARGVRILAYEQRNLAGDIIRTERRIVGVTETTRTYAQDIDAMPEKFRHMATVAEESWMRADRISFADVNAALDDLSGKWVQRFGIMRSEVEKTIGSVGSLKSELFALAGIASAGLSQAEAAMGTLSRGAVQAMGRVERQLEATRAGPDLTPAPAFHVAAASPATRTVTRSALQAQKGFHGIVRTPRWLLVGEHGDERVDVSPLGARALGLLVGGGGGGSTGGGGAPPSDEDVLSTGTTGGFGGGVMAGFTGGGEPTGGGVTQPSMQQVVESAAEAFAAALPELRALPMIAEAAARPPPKVVSINLQVGFQSPVQLADEQQMRRAAGQLVPFIREALGRED